MQATKKANGFESLFAEGRQYQLAKGQIINMFDQSKLFLVKEGYVKRYLITREGEHSIQSIYGAGQVFPLTNAMQWLYEEDISNEQKTYFYQTLSDTVLITIPIETLSEYSDSVWLYRLLLHEAAKRLRFNIQQLDNKSLKSARWRIAHQ